MAIHFDNVIMPTAMATRGVLNFGPPELLGTDGEGRPIYAPVRRATWEWAQLQPAEADWLTQTLLGGSLYRACFNGCVLNDPMEERLERSFDYCVVQSPTWSHTTNGVYYKVKIEIRDIT